MKRTFKPNVEKLEDRLVMTTPTEELYGNFHFLPAVRPEMSLTQTMAEIETAPAPTFNLSSFAGQTIRLRFAETNNQAPADYSAIAFVGGWGSSSYQYAFAGTYTNAAFGNEGNDVLLGGFGQDYEPGLNHGVSVLAWARVDSANTPMLLQALTHNEQATGRVHDDVWVDGNVITGDAAVDPFDLSDGDAGDSEATGGNINVYFHVIRRSSLDDGHGTHTPGTIGAVGNNSALAEHEVGHWMGFAVIPAPDADASGMTLKGQKILQNAPDDSASVSGLSAGKVHFSDYLTA